MKIYLDFNKQCISKVDNENVYEGDIFSNVFELLFFNYGTNENWFPTMSQLAPNGRGAGDFGSDPIEENESHEYVEDDVTYLRYTFTMGEAWVNMVGRSQFFVWVNTANPFTRKCLGKVNVMINQSNNNYFISDPTFNPNVKAYIDAEFDEIERSLADEIDEIEQGLGDGSPKYFDTTAHIIAQTDNRGLAVATDTGYLYFWDDSLPGNTKYAETGLIYNDMSYYYTKGEADILFALKANTYTKTESDNLFAPKDTTFSSIRALEDNYTTGKNIFNKNTVTSGYYIKYDNGGKTENASFSYSEFIPVKSSTSYTLNKTYTHIAFYDINKDYISGDVSSSTSPFTFTTTNDTKYVIISTNNSNLNSIMVNEGSIALNYEDYYKITADNIMINGTKMFNGVLAKEMADGDFYNTIKKTDIALKYTNNMLNPNAVTNGYYIAYNSGVKGTNANYSYTDFIPVKSSTIYWVNKTWTHIAFYNSKFEYVSGALAEGTVPYSFTTTAETKYIIVSTNTSNLPTTMLNEGVSAISFEPFGVVLDKNTIIEEKGTTVVVDKNGGGDYTSFVDCINAISPSKENPVTIIVKEGTYDLREEDSNYQEDYSGYLGIVIPYYVNVVGYGNRDNIILKMECDTEQTYISTLTLTGTCSFKNITISGKKTRYTIHDDIEVTESYSHTFDNVRFIGSNLHYHHCYGSGMRKEGGYYEFKNCTFDCDENAFSVHNSAQATGDQKMHEVYFQNCRFNNPINYYSVVAHSITNCSNGFVSNIYMYGNKCNGKLGLDETTPTTDYGEGICWKITGYCTSYSDIVITNTDGEDYTSYVDIFNIQ